MHEAPKLRVTKNYDLFEIHPLNRPLEEKPVLLSSMKQYGFMASSPLQCIRNGNGKLKVLRGHHRLHYAKRLKLSVWYVIDESNTDIYSLEGPGGQQWSLNDFVQSRANAGDENCARILAFQKKYGLKQQTTISLLNGNGGTSTKGALAVKMGKFKVAPDLKHAVAVVGLVEHARARGITFAGRGAFVAALSAALRVPEFDAEVFKHKLTRFPGVIQSRPTWRECLEEIEALYNYQAKGKRAPIAFRAIEIGRQRQRSFGGTRPGNGKTA